MTLQQDGLKIALERIEREACERTGFLDLGGLRLESLPKELFRLVHLRELSLGAGWKDESRHWRKVDVKIGPNEVSASLEDWAALRDLRKLWVSGTFMASLEPLVGVQALQSLSCAVTEVSDLAPLGKLQALRVFDCARTQVSDLTPLAGLQALRELDCAYTKVSDLTPLAGLQALRELNCSQTLVSDLAPLAGLPKLEHLFSDGLKIAEFPRWWLSATTLRYVSLYKSSIPTIPPEVLSNDSFENCLPALRAHFRDLDAGEARAAAIKLMVLGNGRVGKTQLCLRLSESRFDPNSDTTHGVTIIDKDLPFGVGDAPVSLQIWDFGGQDIYHGTHALFMRANAVFALIWARGFELPTPKDTEDEFSRNRPLGYWVDYASRLGGKESAALVVQTRVDSPRDGAQCPVKENALRERFGYCETLRYSAKNDRGRPELNEKLAEAIDYLNHQRGVAVIGAARHRVKTRLEEMRAADNALPKNERRHRTMTQQEFLQLCEEEKLQSEPKFLLDYLHNAGVVFYREALFEDRIILDQAWALDAIYAVFHRERSYKQLRELGGRSPARCWSCWSGATMNAKNRSFFST
jgi:internalin A